jgi:hypothetical protein
MKKVLFIFALVLSFSISKAQSNLTLIIADKVEKGYFKQESFKWSVSGFKSLDEANKFLAGLKKDTNIKTAEISAGAVAGEYNLSLSVNKIYGRPYFERVMMQNGVKYAKVNGETKELVAAKAAGK